MVFVVIWLLSIVAIFVFSGPALRDALIDQRDVSEGHLNGRFAATAAANVRREGLRVLGGFFMLFAWIATFFLLGEFKDTAIFGYSLFLVGLGVIMAAQSFLDRRWRKNVVRVELDRALKERRDKTPQRREGEH